MRTKSRNGKKTERKKKERGDARESSNRGGGLLEDG
jgi:hypothetical protein